MARDVVSGSYTKVPDTFGDSSMPAVRASFTPKFGGTPYAPAKSVLDSGAPMTLVPHGVPKELGWSSEGVSPSRLRGVTPGESEIQRYLATFHLESFTHEAVVWELPEGSGIKCVLIGQDLLRYLVVILDGLKAQFTVKQRWS